MVNTGKVLVNVVNKKYFSPVVNTGKVLVNVVAGQLLGETPLSAGKIIGLLILLSGIILQLTA